MKKTAVQIVFVLIISISIFAQNEDQELILYDDTKDIPLKTMLYTSIGSVAYELSQNKELRFQINIYGGNADYFSGPYLYKAYISTQLKINYQVPAERFLVQNCNIHKEELRVRVYKVPKNVEFKTCQENFKTPAKTVLFETLYFYPSSGVTTLYEKAIEETIVDLYVAESQYSKTSLAVLKNLLENDSKSKVYLISYLGKSQETIETKDEKGEQKFEQVYTIDNKTHGKKILNNIQEILESNGIKSSNIKRIEGGQQEDQRHVEIWFVPKGGEIPKPTPDYFQKKK
jgi:hypothetical protein